MDEVIFLEMLEADDVHARHRLDRFPVTVGRGYANDIILDDPKVSASHLRIDRAEDGRLVLRDTGSTNGTFRVEPWARLAELELTDDARVAVGDTVLRFRSRSHVVEDTRVAAIPVAPQGRPFERPFAFPAMLAVAVLTFLLREYLTNYQKTDWGSLALAVVAPVFVSFVWSGLWSVASKVARRVFHFGAHGTIGSLGLLGLLVIPLLIGVLTYSLGLGAWVRWLYLAGYLGWMGFILFWHLRYVTRAEPRRLMTLLGIILVCFGALTQADSLLGEEDFSSSLDFDRTLLPPAFQLVPSKPVDSFFEGTQKLQEDVDALAKEKP
ncbi:type III secretion system (T3SS) inner membrane Yop/YscD-like protein [Archangium gephyra]|uniref:FHA domain protein n=1 Tax=Archangium gephyra TaxID=48 RepID=A0AAC8QBC3_9BACT|nr:FHA domain-containing protein [Archangium gephyra]AKJ04235.1 FHA domain protein [Archangium gephyra]REG37685.1 type III secretion system (T3SS) inner membrane Yop/YscD-like protein [Archangium gephyra]